MPEKTARYMMLHTFFYALFYIEVQISLGNYQSRSVTMRNFLSHLDATVPAVLLIKRNNELKPKITLINWTRKSSNSYCHSE